MDIYEAMLAVRRRAKIGLQLDLKPRWIATELHLLCEPGCPERVFMSAIDIANRNPVQVRMEQVQVFDWNCDPNVIREQAENLRKGGDGT